MQELRDKYSKQFIKCKFEANQQLYKNLSNGS
jgi:hypothetical protein